MTLTEAFQLPDTMMRKIRMAQNAKATREIARLALDCLDLTSLTGKEEDEDIFNICDAAKHNRLHSVCVYPSRVETVCRALKHSNIVAATVINFPHGNRRTESADLATPESVKADVEMAIKAGARQIDIVLAHEDFRSGSRNYSRDLLRACRQACPSGITMKVVIETSSFESPYELRESCKMAIKQGANCLKTSTGKYPGGGASLEHAAILFDEANKSLNVVGVKISGGIKTVEQCAQYITLGRSLMGWNSIQPKLFRIGGSTLLQPLLDTLHCPAMNEPEDEVLRPVHS